MAGRFSRTVDRTVAAVAPRAALRRAEARAKLTLIDSATRAATPQANAYGLTSYGDPTRGYGRHGASRRKKSLLGWLTRTGSPDEDITRHQPLLAERAIDLDLHFPYMTGIVSLRRNNTVGPGFTLNSKIDHEFLGLTQEQRAAWEAAAEREFRLWAAQCDVRRTLDFGMLSALVYVSALLSGDVFAALPVVDTGPDGSHAGDTYATKVQAIEAARVSTPPGAGVFIRGKTPPPVDEKDPAGRDITGGIEVGAYGEPVAAWIADRHPGAMDGAIAQWERVPFRGRASGRRQLLHIISPRRPEQRRGAPIAAPIMELAKQLQRYSSAELDAAVIAAKLTVFITSEIPERQTLGPLPDGFDGTAETLEPADSVNTQTTDEGLPAGIELGNGAVLGLAPGESVATVNPSRPNQMFDAFVTSICAQIGAGTDTPIEFVKRHFNSSYTAARAAFIELWKSIRFDRHWIESQFLTPCYEAFLTEAVLAGRLQAPGFFEDPAVRAAWLGAEWYGPAPGQINPLAEVNAAVKRVDASMSTLSQETAELSGRNWSGVNAERGVEIQEQIRHGTARELAPVDPADEPTEFGED